MIERGIVTQVEFQKHIRSNWRQSHGIWEKIRNYVPNQGYSKAEIDAFFEGYDGGKAQVHWDRVTGKPTIGIADDNLLEVDGDPNADEYARFTANGLEGRTEAEFKADFNLQIGTDVLAQQAIGIADDNLLEVDDADAADDDYAKFTANGLEGRDYGEVRTDLGLVIGTNVLAQQAIGIADNNLVEIDSGDVAAGRYAKFTANGLDGRTAGEVADDIEALVDHGNLAGLTDVGDHNWAATKTTAAWNKSIGSGGDYADWATMIAAMPDTIAHAVTVMIKTGTTLTGTCNIKNKQGLTDASVITIQAEDFFPQSGFIPIASSATATTLVDSTQSWDVDRFIDCWVFVVHGTGTDNGFTKITDSDATSVTVSSWSGTEPDNTSRYIIIGALIDSNSSYGFDVRYNDAPLLFKGIGITEASSHNFYSVSNKYLDVTYCGFYKGGYAGVLLLSTLSSFFSMCGFVGNNTSNNVNGAGVALGTIAATSVRYCSISDNNRQGIAVLESSYVFSGWNFGDANGTWGSYAKYSGQAKFTSSECSGTSGNHSDPGTAGDNNADQAAAY